MTSFLVFYPGDAMVLLMVNVLTQIAVVAALAWAISTALARHRAAVRHAIWLSALGCVLLSPIMAYVAPRAGLSLVTLRLSENLASPFGKRAGGEGVNAEKPRIGLAHASRPLPNPLPKGEGTATDASPKGEETAADTSPKGQETVADGFRTWPSDPLRALVGLATAFWAAGVLLLVARLLHGWWSIARLKRRLQPVDGDRFDSVLGQVRRILSVSRLPPVATCPAGTELAGPITIGVFRPLVILPEKLLHLLDSRGLRDVLLHECAHALRRDPLVGLVQRLAGIFYWPYPPVHFLNRRLAWAREEICDNYVLHQHDGPSYAETLLVVSQTLSGRMRPAALGLFHPRGKLEQRVAGLLDERRNVMVRVNRITLAVLTAVLLTAVVVVAGTRFVQAQPPSPPVPPVVPGASVPPAKPAAPQAPVPPTSAPYLPRQDFGRIEPLDVLQIRVVGTIVDQPIDGFYLVEPDGQVALGPAYGRANVKGLTMEQAEEKIARKLREVLAKPDVQVVTAGRAARWREGPPPTISYTIKPGDWLFVNVLGTILDQPIHGLYRVEPTGTVALGPAYGRTKVQGLTLDGAEKAIQRKLAEVLKKPDVQVTFGDWEGDENMFGNRVGPMVGAARQAAETAKPQPTKIAKPQNPAPPKASKLIAPGDVIRVEIVLERGAPGSMVLNEVFLVEDTGTVALGAAYGRFKVAGLTLEGAEKEILKGLQDIPNLKKALIQVTYARNMGADSPSML
jgi:beta-lactamase regulating signal transducer with metallopeptidase domain/protein involved in polysaccharide export with SLBB domain